MSRHEHWNKIGIREAPTSVQMLAYVKGYILALDDVLKDIEENDSMYASDVLMERIHQSLAEARETLEHLL